LLIFKIFAKIIHKNDISLKFNVYFLMNEVEIFSYGLRVLYFFFLWTKSYFWTTFLQSNWHFIFSVVLYILS
jgi:hypothetical protein